MLRYIKTVNPDVTRRMSPPYRPIVAQMPGVNYVSGSGQLRRRVARPSPPAMAGGGDIEK